MSTEIITLESEKQRLQLAPAMGGSITDWDWKPVHGWTPLLRPWDGVSGDRYTFAGFPMVPWSNRISQGGFEHDGAFYPLRANRSDEHYPIHGDGWLQAWQVAERSNDRVKLTLESRHFEGNPYHYRSTETFLLLPDGLQIDLTVTHLGQKTLPYGLGLHPYFLHDATTRLRFKTEGVWLADADTIAAEHTANFPQGWDYNAPSPLDGPLIDNCYTGWNGRAVIDYPDHGISVTMIMPDCNGYMLFYRPPGYDYFCIEPTTHPIDAFHLPEQPGLSFLGHGDSLALRTKFLVGSFNGTSQ